MKLRPQQLEIPEKMPFAHDVLNRRQCAEALSELIQSSEQGIVIGLHGEWGEGKSAFLRMWEAELRGRSVNVLYFNAWESDYFEDALVCLIGEMQIHFETKARPGLKSGVEKMKRLSGALLRKSLPVIAKLGTTGLLDLDELSESMLADHVGKMAEERINAYEESKKSIQSFRVSLSSLAKEATLAQEGELKFPLVFLVDELDRCRPPFAVRLLECIKHLFAVPGVAFVLALDRNQLAHAVQSQYGAGIDAIGYLRRFFDIELYLPRPDRTRFVEAQFLAFGLDQLMASRPYRERDYLQKTLLRLGDLFRMSLRDIERCMAVLVMAVKATPERYYLNPELVTFLIVLKIKAPGVYETLLNPAPNADTVLEHVRSISGGERYLKSPRGYILEAVFRAASYGESKFKSHYTALAQGTEGTVHKEIGEKVLSFLQHGEFRGAFNSLKPIIGRIELFAPEVEREDG